MPFIPGPTGAIRVVVSQSLEGQEVINVLYFKAATNPTSAELLDLAQDVGDAWTDQVTGVLAWCNEELVVEEVSATHVTAANGVQRIVPFGIAGAGASSSQSLNNTLAVVASLRTAQTGRSFRGRLYLAGIDVSAALSDDTNHINAAAVTGIGLALANVQLAAVGSTLSSVLSVASYYTRPVPDVPLAPSVPRATGLYTTVDSIIVRPLLGSQRRRKLEA